MLEADDSEFWQRIFCETRREIIIFLCGSVKDQAAAILETALLP
jgi:hypothetical protein